MFGMAVININVFNGKGDRTLNINLDIVTVL